MAQTPSSSRRTQILEAALRCFMEVGVADTTMSAIAKAAKVDPPLVHYHFPTREILYREAFLVVLESLKEASVAPFEAAGADPIKILSSYVQAPFDWVEKNPGYASIWLYFYYLASFVPPFRDLSTQIREVGRQRIEFLILQGIERGVFRVLESVTAAEVALQIQSLMTGAGLLYITENSRDRSWVEATVRQVLAIVGADGASAQADFPGVSPRSGRPVRKK